MDFATSSHRRRWLYTRGGLEEERRKLAERVVEGVRRQRAAADPGEPEAGSATKRQKEPPPVDPAGELLTLKYYQQIIQEKCREMRLPVKVMSTAILYHKRFFLRHSSMEFDPGRVMITAIFMATKIEEHYTRAADIAAAFDVSEDLVVKQEVALLEGLNFDLVVHSPYRALQGLMQELKEARAASASSPPASAAASPSPTPAPASPPAASAPSPTPTPSGSLPPLDDGLAAAAEPLIADACKASFGALDALVLSDAPLMHGPAQLAAAALRSGFKGKGVRIPNFIARIAMRACAATAAAAATAAELGGSTAAAIAAAEPLPPADPAAALTKVLDELDALGSWGARRVDVSEVKEANAAAREWRALLKDAGGAGAGGKAGAAVGEDAVRAAKREAKKAARAAAKAKQEAELLGVPQPQPQ
ncbi:hypothetical protein HYH03_018093 [Edaphochlamys debaryana]|uniref:Cyclin-like domain-containing protein n=1 Tax=Edaphochlamys debaryana TaxID=47281 RepID=A0A836BPW3_9CHLO|nr:hypothetical protein HYH03_018093 [Edaphochlamys debaryana]|eukprot:KAG2483013.1 hypothetical protein HYH03_018093 [Edaphochlamys debaryana]